jgi:hypothetical protein
MLLYIWTRIEMSYPNVTTTKVLAGLSYGWVVSLELSANNFGRSGYRCFKKRCQMKFRDTFYANTQAFSVSSTHLNNKYADTYIDIIIYLKHAFDFQPLRYPSRQSMILPLALVLSIKARVKQSHYRH